MAGDKRKGKSNEFQPKINGDPKNKNSASNYAGRNIKEDYMVDAVHSRATIMKYQELFDKLSRNRIDINGALQKLSADALLKIMDVMIQGTNDKVQLEAAKELLDRAGYSKVNKVAVAGTLDANASKDELMATILGLSKSTGELEIVDDEEQDTTEEE